MLRTLNFTVSEHWAPFNFPQSTAMIMTTYFSPPVVADLGCRRARLVLSLLNSSPCVVSSLSLASLVTVISLEERMLLLPLITEAPDEGVPVARRIGVKSFKQNRKTSHFIMISFSERRKLIFCSTTTGSPVAWYGKMSVNWSQESCQTLSYQDRTLNNSQAEKYEKKKSEINQVLLYRTQKRRTFWCHCDTIWHNFQVQRVWFIKWQK